MCIVQYDHIICCNVAIYGRLTVVHKICSCTRYVHKIYIISFLYLTNTSPLSPNNTINTYTGGKGLWSLWTRNFKSTLLMLMDLVDNSVDAAMQKKDTGNDSFTGRVQIYRDLYEVMPEQVYTTGLCIRNNAPKKITPLKEVLKLFISDKKDSGTENVGENGVGLKQSCAGEL